MSLINTMEVIRRMKQEIDMYRKCGDPDRMGEMCLYAFSPRDYYALTESEKVAWETSFFIVSRRTSSVDTSIWGFWCTEI